MTNKFVNGQVIQLTPEEEAIRAAESLAWEQEESIRVAVKQADDDALVSAKADATIKYLVNHTPAEITTKVRQLVNAAGVTNLATAQTAIISIEDLLVRIAIALSVAAKDRLR